MHSIFMYGSNLYLPRLRKRAPEWDGKFRVGQLPNFELKFHKRSCLYQVAASISPHPYRTVWGIAIQLNETDLERMDGFESVSLEPKQYSRHSVTVKLIGEQSVEAQTYIAEPDFVVDGLNPTVDYLNFVVEGGRHCGLPASYLEAIARLGTANSRTYLL